MKSQKVLFIATSHDKLGGTNEDTGVWLEELAAPYYLFREAGIEIAIASPAGGLVPLDPKSRAVIVATPPVRRFLKDTDAMAFLANSLLLEDVVANDYDAVLVTGGHGAMWDIISNTYVKTLLEAFNNAFKPIGAVCHGVVGLLAIKNDMGEPLIKGRQLTGFSNSEEASAGLTMVVPVLVETELTALGALYSKGANYVSHVVSDGNLITGQNAASSEEVAKRVYAILQQNKLAVKPQQAIDN